MKTNLILFGIFVLAITFAACNTSPTPTETGRPSLPTPAVPPLEEIDTALQRWENSQTRDYFAEIEERSSGSQKKVRLVVAAGQVRAAQLLEIDSSGNWGEPAAIPLQEANQFTVEAMLQRVRRDALGNGPVPFNMKVAFDRSLGIPAAVHAEALPAYSSDGKLVLDRQYTYDLIMNVKALLEEVFGLGKEPVLILTRSGGPEAWCDSLRVFFDGSSVYSDDCRDTIFQLSLPENRLEELDLLRESFASLDDIRQEGDQTERLIITGSGNGTPDAATLQAAWELAWIGHSLLSKPIGLGLTALYIQGGKLFGFDAFNKTAQLASLRAEGELRSAAVNAVNDMIAYTDDSGVKVLDPKVGQTTALLASTEEAYFAPRVWSNAGYLLLAQVPLRGDAFPELGWVSMNETSWHALPLSQEATSYGCDTGASWSPEGSQLAITGLGYGHPCNINPGLTLVELTDGTAKRLVAPIISDGLEGESTIIAGAHTPAWSPDGKWIAFGLDQDANAPLSFSTRLYRVRPDGTDLTPLTSNSQGLAAHPAWAPDGNLYYGLDGDSAETDGIYRYNPTTNTHTLIISGANLHPLSISPDGEFMIYEQVGELQMWAFLEQGSTPVTSGEQEMIAVFAGWLTVEDE